MFQSVFFVHSIHCCASSFVVPQLCFLDSTHANFSFFKERDTAAAAVLAVLVSLNIIMVAGCFGSFQRRLLEELGCRVLKCSVLGNW